MYQNPTLLRWDSPPEGDQNDPQHSQIVSVQHRRQWTGRGGHSSCSWRRKDEASENPPQGGRFEAAPTSPSSRPLAPVGVTTPQLAARSTDSDKIHSSSAHAPQTTEETQGQKDQPQQEETRKLIASIPDELLASLRATCNERASSSLLGRIQGKHPGLKALTAWARVTLHSSLSLLSLKTNNLFEITFATPEGRIHALNQADLTCEGATILLSSWQPHFDPKNSLEEDRLDHPVWMQIVDLCQVLREEAFLHTIGEQIGQVISIDNSEAYRAKLFGPRIRLLVRDLSALPQTVVIPRLDGEGPSKGSIKPQARRVSDHPFTRSRTQPLHC